MVIGVDSSQYVDIYKISPPSELNLIARLEEKIPLAAYQQNLTVELLLKNLPSHADAFILPPIKNNSLFALDSNLGFTKKLRNGTVACTLAGHAELQAYELPKRLQLSSSRLKKFEKCVAVRDNKELYVLVLDPERRGYILSVDLNFEEEIEEYDNFPQARVTCRCDDLQGLNFHKLIKSQEDDQLSICIRRKKAVFFIKSMIKRVCIRRVETFTIRAVKHLNEVDCTRNNFENQHPGSIKPLIPSVKIGRPTSDIFFVGHRGMGADNASLKKFNEFPENTIKSFQRAFELGLPMVELDILPTKHCRSLVIHHNHSIRLCDTNESKIGRDTNNLLSKLSLNDLRKMCKQKLETDVSKFEQGLDDELPLTDQEDETDHEVKHDARRIPRLIDVLREVDPKLAINIEVKYPIDNPLNVLDESNSTGKPCDEEEMPHRYFSENETKWDPGDVHYVCGSTIDRSDVQAVFAD
ncbi:Glycerophosphocholine phosphodiesterase [Cichlidogyrus casuarinus]|uniref:Glycerophosphocholine phosphodiesterase n=1 Tax=Cichlidogyrus casuarinus TaxID=1844966 RepID=A0ABD2Q506_9PLAT